MRNVERTIEMLASSLMTIPRDYPQDLRKASYKATLEGFARFVISEKLREEAETLGRAKDDMQKVAEIMENSRIK